MACALPLVLASADPECRIICVPEIAAQLRATSMLSASKLLVIAPGGSADLGIMRITMVHANHVIDKMEMMMMGTITSAAKKPSSGTISGKSAASTASSASSALSFSGGASAGWVI